ncbi:Coronin, partial [Operophtera brumata]
IRLDAPSIFMPKLKSALPLPPASPHGHDPHHQNIYQLCAKQHPARRGVSHTDKELNEDADNKNYINETLSSDDNRQEATNQYNSENDLSKAENDLSKAENDLSKAVNDLSKSENDLSKAVNDLSKSEYYLSKTENDFSKTEDDINKTENLDYIPVKKQRSKSRWAIKRAQQNKKLKFKVSTNFDETFKKVQISNEELLRCIVSERDKDLYPDTLSDEASMTAEEWLAGEDAEPCTMSLKGIPTKLQERALVVQGGYVSGRAATQLHVTKKNALASGKDKDRSPTPGQRGDSQSGTPASATPPPAEKQLSDLVDEIRKLKSVIVKQENRIRSLEAIVKTPAPARHGTGRS